MERPPVQDLVAADLLYRALDADKGVVLETNDQAALAKRLEIAKGGQEAFLAISIHCPKGRPNEVWLVKK